MLTVGEMIAEHHARDARAHLEREVANALRWWPRGKVKHIGRGYSGRWRISVAFKDCEDELPSNWRADIGRCIQRARWITIRNALYIVVPDGGMGTRRTNSIMRMLGFRDPTLTPRWEGHNTR